MTVECFMCGTTWTYRSHETRFHQCFHCGNQFKTRTLKGSVFVYLIECDDHTIYTGITNDLNRRWWQHTTPGNGGAVYTAQHGAKELLGTWECSSRAEAMQIETAIKKNLTSQEKRILAHYWNQEPEEGKPFPYQIWKKYFAY